MLDVFPLVIVIVVAYRTFYFLHFLTNFSLLASEKNDNYLSLKTGGKTVCNCKTKPQASKVWQSTMSLEGKNAKQGNIDSFSENGLFAHPAPCRRLRQSHEGSLACCPFISGTFP